jgi:hypothetical protein
MCTPALAAPVLAVGFDHAAMPAKIMAAKTEATVSRSAARPRPLHLHAV